MQSQEGLESLPPLEEAVIVKLVLLLLLLLLFHMVVGVRRWVQVELLEGLLHEEVLVLKDGLLVLRIDLRL